MPGQGCIDQKYPISTVMVQTAGSSTAEIIVTGVKDIQKFKDLVMAQKKAHEHGTGAAVREERGVGAVASVAGAYGLTPGYTAPPQAVSMKADPEIAPLLRDIRDVLLRIEAQGKK